MTACRCIEGAVRADRDKRTVECACGRCTPRRVVALEALIASLTARVEALERAKEGAS